MSVTLNLSCEDMDAEDLQDLTREMVQSIADETDLDPKLPEESVEAGQRGGGLELGQIVLTFISSGAAVALINVLKSYADRRSGMTARVKTPEGVEIELELDNLDPAKAQETIALLTAAVGKD
jgi:hypothetical protein